MGINGNGIITIGQEQDAKGGKFDDSQRFYGRLNRVNVFKRFVNSKSDCEAVLRSGENGDILSWKEIKQDTSLWKGNSGGFMNLQKTSAPNDFLYEVDYSNRLMIGNHKRAYSTTAASFVDIGHTK